jgi:hypothetical protein
VAGTEHQRAEDEQVERALEELDAGEGRRFHGVDILPLLRRMSTVGVPAGGRADAPAHPENRCRSRTTVMVG